MKRLAIRKLLLGASASIPLALGGQPAETSGHLHFATAVATAKLKSPVRGGPRYSALAGPGDPGAAGAIPGPTGPTGYIPSQGCTGGTGACPPAVTTLQASSVSQAAATLNGTVNPEGSTVNDCHFDWGTSTTYGGSVPCAQSPGSGTSPVAVSAGLPGLVPNGTYHFRVVASTSIGGPSIGSDQTFATLPSAPSVGTAQASAISQAAATLNGTVNPNGGAVSDCHFDWGPTAAYGNSMPCALSPGSGTSPVAVSDQLSGLATGTYHFRVVAMNAGGTSAGADQTFATASAPSVSSSPPSVRSSSGAAFSGSVTPDGLSTSAHFEYGLDPRYTASSGGAVVYDQSTADQQVGSDFALHPVAASVSALVPNALYHVRLVASNNAGAVDGPDQTFMTATDPAPPPPVLGRQVNVVPVSGVVFVKLPRGKARRASDAAVHGLVKGRGFVPLTEARQLPMGSQIDARVGTLRVVAAGLRPRHTQNSVLAGALFSLQQARHGPEKGLTTFRLLAGIFPGAPTFRSCQAHRAGDGSGPDAQAARLSGLVLQTLHARTHGYFRTIGRWAAATSRGTVWDTIDRCDGTLTVVHRGTISVFDFRRRKTITVHAGQRYLAKAARRLRR